jgi:hypothetical protein
MFNIYDHYGEQLTEMYTWNLYGGKGWPARKADVIPQSMSRLSRKRGNIDVSHPYGTPRSVTGIMYDCLPILNIFPDLSNFVDQTWHDSGDGFETVNGIESTSAHFPLPPL